jgi:hypothetical protein
MLGREGGERDMSVQLVVPAYMWSNLEKQVRTMWEFWKSHDWTATERYNAPIYMWSRKPKPVKVMC